jgi:predicted transposase YdaD
MAMMWTPELREVLIDIGFAAEWEEKGREEGREKGREEGREEGWEKGRERGREEEQRKMTKNLLAHGIDPVIIAESSGLALDEIRKIAD